MGSKAVGQRPEPDRELARILLAATGEQVDYAYLARKHSLATVRATREELERSAKLTLAQHEPKLDGSLSKRVRDHLCTIGAKVRPDLSPDQAKAWVGALMIALSDLPPHVAAKATERALHAPFEFPSQVETRVRELATEHMDAIANAVLRARGVERAIHDALNPKPQLADETPLAKGEKVLPDHEVHELQRKGGMCASVLRLGLAKGYITADQLLPADDPTISQEEAR